MNRISDHCFVPGCSNSEANSTNVTFHVFPKQLQEEWLSTMGRSRNTFIIDQVICSDHFKSTDFEYHNTIKTIKRDAIPTLNLPINAEESVSVINNHLNADSVQLNNYKQLISFQDTELNENGSEEENYLEYEDITNCRTCLAEIGSEDGHSITEAHQESKIIREMIAFCIPQIASTLVDTDRVCGECLHSIQFCFNFIENCLKVEVELQENIDETVSNSHETNETDYVENVNSETYNHVFLDHSYIPQPEVTPGEETIANHPTNTPLECVKCGGLFRTKNYLLAHIRKMHDLTDRQDLKKKKVIPFSCEFCDKSFLTKMGYDLHLRISHREQAMERKECEVHTCTICESQFSSLNKLTEHNLSEHGFSGADCSQSFQSKMDLDVHSKGHPKERLCHVCGKCFKTEANLKVHMPTHNAPNTHLCHKCGLGFKSTSSLTSHLKNHNVDSLFLCDQCPSTFRRKNRLDLHKKVRHLGTQDYTCVSCNKKFCYKANLLSHHRLKHSEVKPFQCKQCGAEFGRADYLKRHTCTEPGMKKKRRNFTRKRKYRFRTGDLGSITCKLCNKVFKDIQMLRLHIKTHTTVRRYKCNTCNLTFTTGSNRDRHEKVHKDPSRGFSCGICFKRMETQEALNEHCLINHESSKKYKCHACTEWFARKYLLHSHIAEKHGSAEGYTREEEVLYRVVLNDYLVTD